MVNSSGHLRGQLHQLRMRRSSRANLQGTDLRDADLCGVKYDKQANVNGTDVRRAKCGKEFIQNVRQLQAK